LNHARITISVLLAVGCACLAANGETTSTDSKNAEEPHVQSVTSPSFNPTNYNKIAIVWLSPPKQAPADSSEQSIDDEFTFALVQKGYDVIPSSDTQSLLKVQPGATPSSSAEPDTTKIGKLLNVPAVIVISVSGLTSKPYVTPPPEKASTSTAPAAGGGSNPFGGMPNLLSYVSAPTNSSNSLKFHGWGLNLPSETTPAKNAAQPKPTAPAATTAAPKAAPPQTAPQFMNGCSMSARLFSVEDSRILWMGKVTANSVSSSAQDYSDSIKAAADAIAGAIPARIEAKN